ncbi:MAG: hypothetical protein ACLFM0_09110 [Spirochaetales bacterium]
MRRLIAAMILSLALVPGAPLRADGERPVFAFVGLDDTQDAFSSSEVRVLENQLTSELVRLGENAGFSVTIPGNRRDILQSIIESEDQERMGSLARIVSAYAVIGGQLTEISEEIYVDLRAVRVQDEALLGLVSSSFETVPDAIGGTRSMLSEVFDGQLLATAERMFESDGEPDSRSSVTISDLEGTWAGDSGLGHIEIRDDGTAIASLDDSGSMRLRVRIEDGTIIATQNEPNAPKMYMSTFPYTVAVQIVDIARPMRWEFSLSEDGNRLSGTKDSTFFQIDRGQVVWADNTYTREALWTRAE